MPEAPLNVGPSKNITNFNSSPFVLFKNSFVGSSGHTNLVLDTTNTSASIGFAFRVAGANKRNVIASNDINFRDAQNSDSSVLYLKTGGNVGIGTTSPGDKLQVEGKIRATHLCAADGPGAGGAGGSGWCKVVWQQ